MTVPDVYIIGAPKAGTTSLADWLAAHPSVYFSVPKEPYYWASDYPRMRRHYGFETRAAYEALFSSDSALSARRRAEGSTTYLYSGTAVPDIIKAVPDPRFVVALRNPVDLLISYHRTELVALNEDETDFGKAWARSLRKEQPSVDPLDPKLVDYALVGGLGAAVARLIQSVARERIHFVMFDDLKSDPLGTWRSLTRFLDIDSSFTPNFGMSNPSTKMYRFTALRRLTHRPPQLLDGPMRRLRQWSRTVGNPVVARGKRLMWRPEERPAAPPDVRRSVKEYLAEDVAVLSDIVGYDLSHWLHDDHVPG